MTNDDKELFLKKISDAAKDHLISKKEMLTAYNDGIAKRPGYDLARSSAVTRVFSAIGGGIVFLGIVILVAQNWYTLSSVSKVAVTLGAGVVTYIMGFLFSRDARVNIISLSFFIISALLIPMGLRVTLRVLGYDMNSNGIYSIISGISFSLFLASYFIFKRELFLLFSILYGTWFFYAIVNFLYQGNNPDFNIYCSMIVSVSYILLGHYFENISKKYLSGFLYGFGSLGILLSFFALDIVHKGSFWEWIFPVIIFGVIYLGVLLRSTAFLTFGVLFLIVDIFTITERYFSESLGWPVALVVLGFVVIGIAYFYFAVKRKYFK